MPKSRESSIVAALILGSLLALVWLSLSISKNNTEFLQNLLPNLVAALLSVIAGYNLQWIRRLVSREKRLLSRLIGSAPYEHGRVSVVLDTLRLISDAPPELTGGKRVEGSYQGARYYKPFATHATLIAGPSGPLHSVGSTRAAAHIVQSIARYVPSLSTVADESVIGTWDGT